MEYGRMMQKAILSYRIAKLMLIIFICSIFMYAVSTFFGPDIGASHSDQKKFLLKMEFPFEATVSPLYEIIVTIQLVIQFMFATMAGMFMTIIATFVLHVASQLDIICDGLSEILDEHKEQELRIKIIKKLIVKHQRTLNLSENIENIFTFISLSQFFFNILVICFVNFILVTSIGTEQAPTVISKCFPYYVALNFEALILCYTGEYLSSKSENISWTAYNSNWYELSIYEIRALLLLTMRSQKPLTLTIGKYMKLSLETFANMLKISASYASVLYALE
ncbi:putative odorant receptor 92a isoform X1 [Apis florea]|uniref:putative odorant receptor 92a isoform X1 n=2 Tax=Apis florea TaxID=7463 RepID=UPI0012FEEF8D|nr:putative odorant receptor 92a isoform X1 [Apis florea]XP_031774696.1 putative odorant receptor 92a isoform X1 [Apis florea]